MRIPAPTRGLTPIRLAAAVAAIFAVATGPAQAAEVAVSPASFAAAFAAAQPGDTLLLASGDYGRFRGAMKPGPAPVTVRAQAGATPVMAFSFNPASNITLDGLRITDGYVAGAATRNITVRNSNFDGARFLARGGPGDLVNANVLLDGNTHRNVNVCSGCYDGRVQIAERTEQPTGITIRNSLFEGGNADGIQNGGNGTRILGNTFRALHQPDDGDIAHTGSIQLYGSKNTLIKGNFFYDVSVAVGAYDRADHEIVEDNVVVLDGHNAWVSEYLSDLNSRIRHNTFAHFSTAGSPACAFGVPCGAFHTGHKEADPPSRGTLFKDNILARIDGERRDFAGGEEDHNLFTSKVGWGAHDTLGQPRYVGGERPTTYQGFMLADGSPGKGTASDGGDRGARIALGFGPGLASPDWPLPAASGGDAGPGGTVVRVRSTLRGIVSTRRLRIAVRVPRNARVVLRATVRPGTALRGRRARHSRRPARLRTASRRFRAGRSRTVTISVERSLRWRLKRSRDARLYVRAYVASGHHRSPLGTHRLTIRRSRR